MKKKENIYSILFLIFVVVVLHPQYKYSYHIILYTEEVQCQKIHQRPHELDLETKGKFTDLPLIKRIKIGVFF